MSDATTTAHDLTGRVFTRDGYPFRVTGPAAGVPGMWEARGQSGAVVVPAADVTGVAPTFTLDARLPDGTLAEEHGVSAEDVARARINAPRLGIEILSVTEETPVDPSALRMFGIQL